MKQLLWVSIMVCCTVAYADPDIDKLLALSNNNNQNIIEYPIIIARAYDTEVALDENISGATQQNNTITRSVKTSRSLEINNTADDSWEQTIKRSAAADVGANIGNGGKGFSLKGTASYADDATSTAKRRSIRTEISKDSEDLDSLEKVLTNKTVSFDPNSGRISTAVRLQNISTIGGYVENLRVSLKTKSFETGTAQVLGAAFLCNSTSNLIDLSWTTAGVSANNASQTPTPAPNAVLPSTTPPASCKISVPPQDPLAPYTDVPVSFIRINTGKIQDLLSQDVWIEVESLTVGKQDAAIPAATAIAKLNANTYRFFIMRPDGRNDLIYYVVDGKTSPKAALEDARKGQILFSADPIRVTDINQWQSDLSDWGLPKDFITKDLGQGMWVVASPTFTQTLDKPGLPGHQFDLFYVTKADLLTTLDESIRKPLLVGDPQVFPEINGLIAADAMCSTSTDPQRRVLVGDKIKISISVQEKRNKAIDIGLAGSDPKWHAFLMDFSGQNPKVFRNQFQPVTQVEARDLSKYGVGFSLSNKILPKSIAEWAKMPDVVIERLNGELTLSFRITEKMMPDRKGEACLTIIRETEKIGVGRKYDPFTPPPSGQYATAPGGPVPPQIVMANWAKEEPYVEKDFLIQRKTTGYLEIIRIGRPKDSTETAFRDSDDFFYLHSVCATIAKEFDTYKPNYAMLQTCATTPAANFHTCLRTGANAPPMVGVPPSPVPPPPPAGSSAQIAQLAQQTLLQACQNRKVRAAFIRTCTAKDIPKEDPECASIIATTEPKGAN
ncbi:hypothetical protein [Achromobacter xylosoxidans]|uniref:hypothetical protein n=1 Tax=Alcaligenes xylosoxydans xylosoxydans TaxID=85698 RepID=UPI000B493CAF|nr:hypothetical protein [Achromobacter xylosoxidans]